MSLFNSSKIFKRGAKKCIVLLLGIVFTLSLFEIFLRVFYTTEKHRSTTQSSNVAGVKNFNILFLGNSHTYGAGVDPSRAYPALIENFLNSEKQNTNYNVHVFNGGMLAANTFVIYQNLDHMVEVSKPHLALIMAGEPNLWNKNGFERFLGQKFGERPSLWSQVSEVFLSHSKAINWLVNMSHMTFEKINEVMTSDEKDEILIYKEITASEDNYRKEIIQDELNWNNLKVFEKYIQSKKGTLPAENWRIVLYLYSRSLLFLKKDYSQVVDNIKSSLEFNSDQFDIYSSILLEELSQFKDLDPQYVGEIKKLKDRLVASKNFPGQDFVDRCTFFTLHSRRDVMSGLDVESFLTRCHALFPAYAVPAVALMTFYSKKNDFDKAAQVLIETMKVNPFARREEIKHAFLSIPLDQKANAQLQKEVRDIIDAFSKKYPTEAFIFDAQLQNKVYDWIQWDLKNIADKLQKQNIPLVIQNYHWIRYLKTPQLNNSLQEAAQKSHLAFIDTNSIFQKTVESSSDIESYFVQIFGPRDSHPSEKGHKLIAYITYKGLVEQNLLPPELSHFDPEKLLQ